MSRTAWLLLAGTLLAISPSARADERLAGNWKVSITEQGERKSYWIVKLETRDGKLAGKLLATEENVVESSIEDVRLEGDLVYLTISQGGGQKLRFEGKLPKEKAKAIPGAFTVDRALVPGQLEATKLTSFDPYEVAKEIVAESPEHPRFFSAALTLIRFAAEKKATPEEVRGWADKAFTAAGAHGPRWQRETATRLADFLMEDDRVAALAVEYARKADRMMAEDDEAMAKIRVLEILAGALRAAGKADEVKEVRARIDKLEPIADQEYLKKMPPFKPDTYAGRKGKSDRAVLVELFTGANCPACVAADVALEGLAKTYKPGEVVLLQYHGGFNGAETLINPDTETRIKYYDKEIEGGPTVIFNGRLVSAEGGSMADAQEKYKEYRTRIDPLLETPARARLQTRAVRTGDRIDITAEVSELAQTGERFRLRLALVEEQVRYLGSNRIRFHYQVVRALPGGPEGVPLKDKANTHTVRVELPDLRKSLNSFLDALAKEAPFANPQRPMELKGLRVVAFVQDDATKEVLQAVQVPVVAE